MSAWFASCHLYVRFVFVCVGVCSVGVYLLFVCMFVLLCLCLSRVVVCVGFVFVSLVVCVLCVFEVVCVSVSMCMCLSNFLV